MKKSFMCSLICHNGIVGGGLYIENNAITYKTNKLTVDKKYKNLNEREYKCSKCHNEIDRDLNASINIMFEGLKLYMKNEVRI